MVGLALFSMSKDGITAEIAGKLQSLTSDGITNTEVRSGSEAASGTRVLCVYFETGSWSAASAFAKEIVKASGGTFGIISVPIFE